MFLIWKSKWYFQFRSEEWDGGPGVPVWWQAQAAGAGGHWLDGPAQEEGWDWEEV